VVGGCCTEGEKGEQPSWIESDDLWTRIEPLLPVRPQRFAAWDAHRLADHLVLQGILFVLHNGIQWEFSALNSSASARDDLLAARLEEWNEAGVWQRPHPVLVEDRGTDTGARRDVLLGVQTVHPLQLNGIPRHPCGTFEDHDIVAVT
jgi:transposase